MPKKLSYEEVARRFREKGCELLEPEYKNSEQNLLFKCVCGNTSRIRIGNLMFGQLCMECGRKRTRDAKRTPFEDVRKLFEENGCKLLAEKFINHHTKMPYICRCGREAEINLSNFKSGRRCAQCRVDRMSGENSPNWNPSLTDEDRMPGRKFPGYTTWRRRVLKRDEHTCQKCGEIGPRLNVHHIEAYSRRFDLRTDVNNGVTLCEPCHLKYHRDFYRKDADRESFEVFMYGAYDEPWYAGEEDVDAYIEYLESIAQEN